MTYLLLKYLHLLGAAVLLGTGMGIAFFAWFAYRRAMQAQDIGLLRHNLALTVRADTIFTGCAAVLQPVTGLAMWWLAGGDWAHPWLWSVLGVYAFVGACWLPVVLIQIRLRDAALAAPSTQHLGAGFHRMFRQWFILGCPAFAAMLALFAMMVWRGHWS